MKKTYFAGVLSDGTKLKRHVFSMAALVVIGCASSAMAGALVPDIFSDGISVTYNNVTGNFTASGWAETLTLPGPATTNIDSATLNFHLDMNVDPSTHAFLNGTLSIGGTSAGYTDPLLIGTLTGFTAASYGSGSTFNFPATVTGGSLQAAYGSYANVIMNVSNFTEFSTFTSSAGNLSDTTGVPVPLPSAGISAVIAMAGLMGFGSWRKVVV